ncbi:MAG: hypothetical protein GWP59_07725 [Chlamydiales bacterium]|nr:DUF5414 family protein [Chlamydiales bacterium]NCF71574.1 hypothetical protein [Chlamydiales bacterium]
MLSKKEILDIRSQLQRIFAMKVSRSSYREIQNLIINVTKSNKVLANQVLLSLLSGELQPEVVNKDDSDEMESLIQEFSSQISLAKEIQEKGDFINIITSDLMGGSENSAFLNRVRRIDGDEFHFITDIESTIKVVTHFLSRVNEYKQNPNNKEFLARHKGNLTVAKALLNQLLEETSLNTN